ncbi:MAG: SixA phosphatase family protein [Hasllibacter sp.]
MTRTLILIRHAKSERGAPGPDHARPLNERGRRQAPLIGRWLASNGWAPDLALVSTAARAQQTWEGVTEGLGAAPPREDLRALYHAPPQAMRDALAGRDAGAIALVGHNPGIAELAAKLAGTAPDHPRFYDYPTGATLAVRLTGADWAEALRGTGEVMGFAIPADLE